jgi:hypothetical protein
MNTQNTHIPISVWNYARGNNNKAIYIEFLNVTFYMSYNTCVAFNSVSTGLVIQDNIWGNTTGAHLNAIDGGDLLAKSKRVNSRQFAEKMLQMEQGHRNAVIAVNDILKEKKETEFRNSRLAERIKLNAGYSKAGH